MSVSSIQPTPSEADLTHVHLLNGMDDGKDVDTLVEPPPEFKRTSAPSHDSSQQTPTSNDRAPSPEADARTGACMSPDHHAYPSADSEPTIDHALEKDEVSGAEAKSAKICGRSRSGDVICCDSARLDAIVRDHTLWENHLRRCQECRNHEIDTYEDCILALEDLGTP